MEEDNQIILAWINDPEDERVVYSRIKGIVNDRLIIILPGLREYRA